MRPIGIALLIVATAFVQCPISSAQAKLPSTPVRAVTEEYFGTKVTDPYRWLENGSDPEVVSWMKAQNDYTRVTLAAIPARQKFFERVKALDQASTRVRNAQIWGGKMFYLKTDAGADNARSTSVTLARARSGC